MSPYQLFVEGLCVADTSALENRDEPSPATAVDLPDPVYVELSP